MRVFLLACLAAFLSIGARGELRFGVASVDITPDYPVRLQGYAGRKSESEGIEAPIFAKALALETDRGATALLITIDTCGLTKAIRDEIAGEIARRHSIPAERLVLLSSHTHYAPVLSNSIPSIFGETLPLEQQERINRYTRELIGKIVDLAGKAAGNLESGQLFFAQGTVGFAKNRRTEGGPVDHALPMLVVKDAQGETRSVVANYACHCTTFGGSLNKVHPDWAGIGRAKVEEKHPGVTALVSIGCGADQNPLPRGSMDLAQKYGGELGAEMLRLMEAPLKELSGDLEFRGTEFDLPFDPLPSRDEWTRRAGESGIVGYHARVNLERLDHGETLPAALPYFVQTWSFGGDLAMVFLPGEVVVDYALRLKSNFDPKRLWVSSYANWVPCYIPSRRILREGGYEAEGSLWYYDRPARLSPETEDLIIDAVTELLPRAFRRN